MDKKYIERPKAIDRNIYNSQYRKDHYKQFAANVKPELKDRIDKFCGDEGISKSEYLRLSIELMEKYGRK